MELTRFEMSECMHNILIKVNLLEEPQQGLQLVCNQSWIHAVLPLDEDVEEDPGILGYGNN